MSHRCPRTLPFVSPILLVSTFLTLVGQVLVAPAAAQQVLKSTPATITRGYYSADAKPVLTVKSGDTVRVETVSGDPDNLVGLGVPQDDVNVRDLREINAKVKDPGPIMVGPIAVEGALPGDVLQIELLDIQPRSFYGANHFAPDHGALPDEFPYTRYRLIRIDPHTGMAEFAPGIYIPVRPFFGSMGVAPASGRVDMIPPGYFAGNLDNKELVAGSTLYIPVQKAGALFSISDGHLAMGDGEVDVSAIEAPLTGLLRFTVRKDMKLHWPRAETPTHIITMGFHETLDEAARRATREMIDYLVSSRGLSREDAYMLTSVAVDLHVTQVVDGVKGIHAMLPKAIFK
jgi:acetamidase/formamidase